MTPPSPSTPSEGEIVESDSEKATTSLCSLNGTNVDRKSRIRVSVSRSPSPYRSPRRHQSRTPSRSPYREPRGAKRLREDDHYGDRVRGDYRRFKVKYEDRSTSRKASRNLYDDIDRSREPSIRHESRWTQGRMREMTLRTWNRSPVRSRPGGPEQGRSRNSDRDSQASSYGRDTRIGKGYDESTSRLSREHSVSDRGQTPVATAPARRDAENRSNQTQHYVNSEQEVKQPAAEYVLQILLLSLLTV